MKYFLYTFFGLNLGLQQIDPQNIDQSLLFTFCTVHRPNVQKSNLQFLVKNVSALCQRVNEEIEQTYEILFFSGKCLTFIVYTFQKIQHDDSSNSMKRRTDKHEKIKLKEKAKKLELVRSGKKTKSSRIIEIKHVRKPAATMYTIIDISRQNVYCVTIYQE